MNPNQQLQAQQTVQQDDHDQFPGHADTAAPEQALISWEASEYIHHEKDKNWFILLVVCGVVLLALAIFLLRSITFSVLIVVMVVAIMVLARRPPRTLRYQLGSQSLSIDDQHYSYGEFRSFGVLQDGAVYSIVLLPIKRFRPGVNVYFPQEYGEQIVDTLGEVIPLQPLQLDAIDKLARKLRF